MKYKTIINEDIARGEPLKLESELKREIIARIKELGANNYEDVAENMRQTADILEEIENHINDEFIAFKYNPMGAWYRVERPFSVYYENEVGPNYFISEYYDNYETRQDAEEIVKDLKEKGLNAIIEVEGEEE